MIAIDPPAIAGTGSRSRRFDTAVIIAIAPRSPVETAQRLDGRDRAQPCRPGESDQRERNREHHRDQAAECARVRERADQAADLVAQGWVGRDDAGVRRSLVLGLAHGDPLCPRLGESYGRASN